jgi:hypothetical protein
MAPKKGTKRVVKVRPALTIADGSFQRVQDRTTMAQYRRTRGERDAEQRQIDAVVEAAWQDWQDAGRPTEWPDMPGTYWTGPKAEFETLQWRVHKAGQYFALKVRFGDIKEVVGENGSPYAECVFVVTDRPKDEAPTPEEVEAAVDNEMETYEAQREDVEPEA